LGYFIIVNNYEKYKMIGLTKDTNSKLGGRIFLELLGGNVKVKTLHLISTHIHVELKSRCTYIKNGVWVP